MTTCIIWGVLIGLVHLVCGYKIFENQIPNGARVPHQCKANAIWHGLGHLNSLGGGARNVFGLDFQAAGFTWTKALCNKDSDGDHKTNGEELGDPSCLWQPGTIPQRLTDISNPAICEPTDSKACRKKVVPTTSGVPFTTQEQWLQEACRSSEFKCDGLDKTANVRQMSIRIPPTKVPALETTYTCTVVEFEDLTRDYHMIALTPIINNSYVMHHLLLYGCADDKPISGPVPCGMAECSNVIGGWTVGVTGQCYHEQAGVRLGKNGSKRLMMEFHWNNPNSRDDLVDSSGLTLYYTPDLRPNDMSILITGSRYIQIPPRSENHVVSSDCTPACTRNIMTGDIYVTSAFNHMHYLGKSMAIEHYRGEEMLQFLTRDIDYNYDTPNTYKFDNPIVVKPGDMLRTICHYASSYKNRTTFFGEATSDEMCFGFLQFFPARNLPRPLCVSWRSLLIADQETAKGCTTLAKKKFLMEFNKTELYSSIVSVCKPFGPCTVECKAEISQAKSRDPCLGNEDSWLEVKWSLLAKDTDYGWKFLAALESCQVEIFKDNLTIENYDPLKYDADTSNKA